MNTSTLLDLLSHTALKGAAVLLVALLLGLGLRRMAAARRYALWITTIATLAVLPLAMWALPAWRVLPKASAELEWPVMEPPMIITNTSPIPPPEDDSSALYISQPALPMPAQAPARPAFSWNISWQDVVAALPLVWMLIVGLLLLRLGSSAWRLRRLEASLSPGECLVLEQTARELGLKRMPRLLIGPRDAVPMVWGVLKPRLLLPQGFEIWSPEKQRAVLLHELAHLKRGDPLALWAAQWVKALHWFNPLIWLTFRQLRADQERACDDAVLRHGVRASDYAQSLLDLSRHNRLAPGLSLCALTITRCAPVEARVKAILDPRRRREGLNLRWLAGLAGGALLITLPVAMLHAIEDFMPRGRILDRNGVVLAESTKEKGRVYPLKTLAAHMVGYIRVPDEGHAQIYGGAALEKRQNAELTAGKDVALTLDMRMQSLADRAMKEAGVTRGAAVVLDPRTGEILAAVSLPSFDPNLFVPSITQKNWEIYLGDRDVPLLNRCVKGFAPGSSFKLLTGLAGGAAGISGQKFNCTGTVTYGSSVMQCWKHAQDGSSHGVLGMSDALAVSCNCYWYQFGNAAGIEQIESMGRKIGFGSAYGITDDEDKGVLPDPAWLRQNRPQEEWSASYTANTSIGMGLVQATPLQMAVLAATVGNGGKVPQPSIVKPKGESSWRADLTQGTLIASDVQPLREGMRLAVNGDSGTGRPARSDKVIIAGKTGTAQNWRINADEQRVEDNLGWFIGFAPFENPQLAFAIFKNGAKTGGGDCGPIGKRIVEEALALPADGSGEVEATEEAKFDFDAAEISREIKLLKVEPKISFKEFKIGNGRVTIIGDASGIDEALQLRKGLEKIGEKWPLLWSFPLPKSLANERVEFQAYGVYRASPSKTEEGSKKTKAAPQSLQRFQKTAKVIGRSSGSLIINKGSLDGIVANSPVITSVGLVGKTATPEPYFTEVILLTDARCLVSAKVEGTLEQGILNGEKEVSEVRPQLHLRFLNRHAKINIGSRVYSSGEGGVFPADLLLGRAKHFKSGDVSGEAVVEPVVDFSTLDRVFVIEAKAGPPEPTSAPQSKPAGQAHVQQQSDAEIRMKPELASQWSALKKAGLLADLPAEAVVFSSDTERLEQYVKGRLMLFRFSLPRESARQWLIDSLFAEDHRETLLKWPNPPPSFNGTFTAANNCTVIVSCQQGETVHVAVFQPISQPLSKPDYSRPIRPFHPFLIAPEESRETRPAGSLAPEYDGKSVTQSESGMPTLDVAVQALRPEISPQEARLLNFRPQPVQIRFQPPEPPSAPMLHLPAPVDRFQGELTEESQKAIAHSYRLAQARSFLRSRMRQALVVRAPQEL